MYINPQLLQTRKLSLNDFAVLCLIRQQKFENNIELLEIEVNTDVLKKFEDLKLIEQVKRKNKAQKELELLRTTKKGNDWIDDLTTAEVTEEIIILYNWVKGIYLNNGKQLGNQKRSKIMLAQFSKESGITKNHLAFLINHFTNNDEEQEYSHNLQYLFFKGESLFSVRFDLYSSRLYQYYLKHENYFQDQFLKIKND